VYVPTWLQDGLANALSSAFVFTLTTTSLTCTFTWLFNNTQTSVLLAILLHGSVDGTATYTQVLADKGVISGVAAARSQVGLLIATVVWAVLLTAVTRGRLSYQRAHGSSSADHVWTNPD
jgi:uncharacterized protein